MEDLLPDFQILNQYALA